MGILTIFTKATNSSLHHPNGKHMMTSSNGNIFRITGALCGEFTCHRWIPLTKASDAELWCFLWSAPEQNNREAGELRCHQAHYDVTVMNNLIEAEQCIYVWVQHANICSDDGLSPVWCKAIIITNAAILSIRPQGTCFSETLFKFKRFHSNKYTWKYLGNGGHFVRASVC